MNINELKAYYSKENTQELMSYLGVQFDGNQYSVKNIGFDSFEKALNFAHDSLSNPDVVLDYVDPGKIIESSTSNVTPGLSVVFYFISVASLLFAVKYIY